MKENGFLIHSNDLILITGSSGFIGSKVVETLLDYRSLNLRCFVRPDSDLTVLKEIINKYSTWKIQIIRGVLRVGLTIKKRSSMTPELI